MKYLSKTCQIPNLGETPLGFSGLERGRELPRTVSLVQGR